MHKIFTSFVLISLFLLWAYKGIAETGIHVDLARDLNELSNLWVGKIVWLGPATSANFPTSPIYYYLLLPYLYLSFGSGLSIIISHAFYAILALGVFVFLNLKKSFIPTILVILTIGLSPWWIKASSMPWNGHMYVSFVLLGLITLYFKTPLFLSSLFFGVAIAIDPAAILAIPILFYEWVKNKNRIKHLTYLILGLLIPWMPIILFEIITKGYLIRHWLEYPSLAELTFSPNIGNINLLLNTTGIPHALIYLSLLISIFMASKREKYWIIFISLPLIFLILVSPLRQYYLLGLICSLTFIIATILSSKTAGRVILTIIILLYIPIITIPALDFTGRSIPRLEKVASSLKNNLDLEKEYALVSVINPQNSTPQADDYRFFLRMKGIKALNIDDYPKADYLLLFIETPNFDYKNFDDFHTQRFGDRKFISSQSIDGIEVVKYGRK